MPLPSNTAPIGSFQIMANSAHLFGGTRKVAGNRIATPFTEPRPGIAPMNRPTETPMKISIRFRGSNEARMPSKRCARISINLSVTAGMRIHLAHRCQTTGRSLKGICRRAE